jgi:hypothetical protein
MEPQTLKAQSVIAFADSKKIASGALKEVALKVKKFLQEEPKTTILIFDEHTSRQVEVDLRGTPEAIARRLELAEEPSEEDHKGPGRPKLGVVSREVTLLPHHWDWLSHQPGGASVTLRKLVEEAKKKNFAKDQIRQAQEAAYQFMNVMAGNLPSFEEALRALYAKDRESFSKWIKGWPKDIREHVIKLSSLVF